MPRDVAHPLNQGDVLGHEAGDLVVHDVLQAAEAFCLVHGGRVVEEGHERLDRPRGMVRPTGDVQRSDQGIGDGLVLGRGSKHT